MKMPKLMPILRYLLIGLMVLGLSPGLTWAQLSINLVAVNASDTIKTVPVKYYLPQELAPEDILDTGVLKIDYDVDKGKYFVHGDVQFEAKQSKTFKISVRDVWQVSEEEIELLKTQLEENLTLLEGGENYSAALVAKDKLNETLDYILAQQSSYSENIERRIEEYRAYQETLEDIRKKVFSLEFLEHEAKSLAEFDDTKTIKFLIQVKNPSDSEEKTVKQKHYLPKEIRSEHIVDSKGFDVRYDDGQQKAYLSKEETFKPAEVKKYEITIKDIWNLPISRVEGLEKRAKVAFDEIAESVYADSGNYLYDRVVTKLQEIRDAQVEGRPIKEHIGIFRVNARRFKAAEDDVAKLEQMLAIVRAKKLEELEKGKVKNILQKLQALKGLAALSEAVFKKGISVTATWRIIMGTLIFIAFFTTWHFITWAKRSKTMGEEQGVKPGETMTEVPKPGAEEEKEADIV